ncbi:MAG: alkaline phosphatase family protein [Myxococcota bacterium]
MPNLPKIRPGLVPDLDLRPLGDRVSALAADVLARAQAAQRERETLQQKVDRVVIVMLENRSFDHLLGWLGPARGGLVGDESNRDGVLADGTPDPATVEREVRPVSDTGFLQVDPGHSSGRVAKQLAGQNQGFVADFIALKGLQSDGRVKGPISRGDWRDAPVDTPMCTLTREALPTYAFFADQFAVCARYFCSVPTGTWPNRMFLYAGTANGELTNGSVVGESEYRQRMPRKLFVDQVPSWRIYDHGFAWLNLFPDRTLFSNPTRLFSRFDADCKAGDLPEVVLIDPNVADVGIEGRANDDHAPADLIEGQVLVRSVYESLRSQPGGWGRTLLVVTYDEHGGLYDHVVPPPAPSNGTVLAEVPGQGSWPTTYGPRVPALVVSPYVPLGSTSMELLDHCSVHATVTRRFSSEGPLTARVAAATSLASLLTLDAPREMPPCPPITSARSRAPLVERYDDDDGLREWVRAGRSPPG